MAFNMIIGHWSPGRKLIFLGCWCDYVRFQLFKIMKSKYGVIMRCTGLCVVGLIDFVNSN